MKFFKLLIITVFLILGYFALITYPYFFSKITRFDSLGFLSVVEEMPINFSKTFSINRRTEEFDNHLLKGEKIASKFKASDNNLGILLFRFAQLSSNVTDTVVFRIKEEGKEDWYYKNNYKANQFQPNEYFTFGFPPVTTSKNKTFVFEVESHSGTDKNGIGLSPKKPQFAAVYKYSKENLTNFNTLSPFISKKLLYVARNTNLSGNWQLLATFVFFLLLVLFMEKKKITVLGIVARFLQTLKLVPSFFVLLMKLMKKKKITARSAVRFLLDLKKNAIAALKIIINDIKSDYLSLEKKIVNFSKKATHRFTSTKFYLLFLSTDTKKRLVTGLLIFLLAFIYRFSATLVDQLGVSLFWAGLGGQGDYDQFIRAATCALNFCPAILGQNFLIESSILGTFYKIFGFTGGLKAYLYLMIILSSIVAALPYLLLSRKHFLTIGGIMGSLYLSTSDYLTHMALNFPPDNGSVFIFSMFLIAYLLAIHIGTIRWLLFFGLVGTIDGLNKLTFLLNDLAVFLLFVPVFLYEKANKIKKFPFVKLNPKLIFYSILPLLVFLVIYSAWEYFVQIKFSTPYYLRGLVETGGSTYASSTYVASTSFNESLSRGNILEILYYYAGSSVVMLKRVIQNAGLNDMFLAPILLGLLFATFRKPKFFIAKLISIVIFASLAFTTLQLFSNNYLGIQDIGQYVYAWSNDIYVNVFLFTSIIFLFILNFRYQAFKLALPIIPYVIMLIILAKNAPEVRLLVHVIAWSIILFSFLIDWILSNANKNYALKRFWIGSILLVLFMFFYTIPKTSYIVIKLWEGYYNGQAEVKYLRWVNSNIPTNAIILAGGKSDLVTVAENIKRPIIYNTQWTGALLIKPNEIPLVKPTDFAILDQLKINEMPGVTPSDFSIIRELQNKDNFKKNKYLILEDDINLWRSRIAGVGDNVFATASGTLLDPDDYSIKVYKFNSTLNKGIYELNLKETGNL